MNKKKLNLNSSVLKIYKYPIQINKKLLFATKPFKNNYSPIKPSINETTKYFNYMPCQGSQQLLKLTQIQ